MADSPLHIFVGWDPAEDEAYQVCVYSLRRHTSAKLAIYRLEQSQLRSQGLYWRPPDPLASSEFTYTRFLVPHLRDYKGWALFVDCDFMFTADIADVFLVKDSRYAAMCVKHAYTPSETIKKNGKIQSQYPKKNWSSFVLWNCEHPRNRALSLDAVNSRDGSYLHQFRWLSENDIGSIDPQWNWLEGWNTPPKDRLPKGIHFTRGGPWYEEHQNTAYADLWKEERAASLIAPSSDKSTLWIKR